MAEQIVEHIREVAEGQIDFEGQRVAEWLATTLLAIIGAASFIAGYILQDIKLTLYIGLGGTALAFLLIVPPWSFFRRHPVKWLAVRGNELEPQGIVVDGKVVW